MWRIAGVLALALLAAGCGGSSSPTRQPVSDESAGFEGGTVGNWVAGGSVRPTLSNSIDHAHTGLYSLKIVWGADGSFPQAQLPLRGLVVGRTYVVHGWVYVPKGSPDVSFVIGGLGVFGNTITRKDAWGEAELRFTATARMHSLQLWPSSPPKAHQLAYLDDVAVSPATIATPTASSP